MKWLRVFYVIRISQHKIRGGEDKKIMIRSDKERERRAMEEKKRKKERETEYVK